MYQERIEKEAKESPTQLTNPSCEIKQKKSEPLVNQCQLNFNSQLLHYSNQQAITIGANRDMPLTCKGKHAQKRLLAAMLIDS